MRCELAWCVGAWLTGAATLAATTSAAAATLPAHDPLSILVVSDEVNPNGLSPAELTQPGDISAAIENPGSGISVGALDEIASDCIDDALAILDGGQADVLIYFAHLGALGCDGSDQSAAFHDAVQTHLRGGGGVVVFHHGAFVMPGKESILQLLGVTASSIEWSVGEGQNVIGVAPGHFVVDNGVTYSGSTSFSADQRGVAAGDYGVFTNAPDERYPSLSYLTAPGETRTTLFASDYAGAVALGYDLRRPDWSGHVVAYQPGEYQPAALDDLAGPNFQILANAIYYVATTNDEPTDPTGGGDGTGNDTADGGVDASGDGSMGTGGPGGTDGGPGGTDGGDGTAGPGGTDGQAADDGGGGGGCSCRTTAGSGTGAFLWALVLGGLGRRRRHARR